MRQYRVETLPKYLLPLFQVYGTLGAAALSSTVRLAAHTCDWDFQTPDGTSIPYSKPCLHCTWHENVPSYFSYYHYKNPQRQHKHVWLQHPAAYMKPIHTYLKWNGVDIVLGSSGHGGQEAMEALILRLQESPSYSSAFFPDGPAGPVHRVKPGVVQVAQATGLPIIPIQFNFESSFRTGWDQKHFPLPYSKVRVKELAPILVSEDDDEDPWLVGKVIEEALT